MENLYADIAARTGGNIYIGVVGPVRTGKSTLIKRIMEQLVIPNIEDPYRAERARDELPQSGSGKTIMTSEPKFVPEEAVEITPGGSAKLRVRMIDSVGYMVDGAVGAEEDGQPRMVTTPWYDYEIPMTQAAELGTQKVMQEHCSIGIVVTTDGSITDIPRADYITAENRAIEDMISTGKPFLTIVNTKDPSSDSAKAVARHIADSFGIEPFIADCQAMDQEDISNMLSALLYAFPMQELRVFLPRWMDGLEWSHPVKQQLQDALLKLTQQIHTLEQAASILSKLKDLEAVSDFSVRNMDLSNGSVSCVISFPEKLFYEVLSEKAGIPIESNANLMQLLCELTEAKKEYDKISDALAAARTTGYGIVMPTADEMTLETPEIVKKSGAFGVKMKAGAPSIHMIRVDIDTEISPMVGDEKQSQELISYLCGEDPDKLWESNIFGKSVYHLIQEGLSAKVIRTPADVREKFRGTLGRIVNEGATGLICLIL
jgi:stage IV sporulation protein A